MKKTFSAILVLELISVEWPTHVHLEPTLHKIRVAVFNSERQRLSGKRGGAQVGDRANRNNHVATCSAHVLRATLMEISDAE